MERELIALFRTRPRDEWLNLLRDAGTQVMPVLSAAQALDDPHNRARGMAFDLPVDDGAPVRQIGTPFHLSDSAPVAHRPAGLPGAESDDILREIGLDQAAIQALHDGGAFSDVKGRSQ